MKAYLTRSDVRQLRTMERKGEQLVRAGLPVTDVRNMLANLTAALGYYNVYRTSRDHREITANKAETLRRVGLARSDYKSLRNRISDAKLAKVLDGAYFGVLNKLKVRKDGL